MADRCLASAEVVPGQLKRCQSMTHPKGTLHQWKEAVRADGKFLVVNWNDAKRIVSSFEGLTSIKEEDHG